MKKYAIIVAGGKGLRMGKEIPKQFLPIAGVPILMRTIHTFYYFDPETTLILVLPAEQQEYWHTLCKEYRFNIPITIVNGGETRYHSVKNALYAIHENGLVAVHDGVRPFVSREVLAHAYTSAAEKGSAVPIIPLTDSIRKINSEGKSDACNRSDYRLVQTPQVFKSEWLLQAYECPYSPNFTDDASVVEQCGFDIHLVDGNIRNIKITTPFDLLLAEAFLKND